MTSNAWQAIIAALGLVLLYTSAIGAVLWRQLKASIKNDIAPLFQKLDERLDKLEMHKLAEEAYNRGYKEAEKKYGGSTE